MHIYAPEAANNAAMTTTVVNGELIFTGKSFGCEDDAVCDEEDDDILDNFDPSITSANFPNATFIGTGLLAGLPNLVSVSAPAVTHLGDKVFERSGLKGPLSLPNVGTISYAAFRGCKDITQLIAPNVWEIAKQAFAECVGLTGQLRLPECARIGRAAFYGTGIQDVDAPNVEAMDSSAFMHATRLRSASFPALEEILPDCFAGCTNLTTVRFPAATRISDGAFKQCERLVACEFPNVAEAWGAPFSGCINLERVKFGGLRDMTYHHFLTSGCPKLQHVDFGELAPSRRFGELRGYPHPPELDDDHLPFTFTGVVRWKLKGLDSRAKTRFHRPAGAEDYVQVATAFDPPLELTALDGTTWEIPGTVEMRADGQPHTLKTLIELADPSLRGFSVQLHLSDEDPVDPAAVSMKDLTDRGRAGRLSTALFLVWNAPDDMDVDAGEYAAASFVDLAM